MRSIDNIANRAITQHGVISLRQLDNLDVSRTRTRTLVRQGVLQRVYVGVYALPGSTASFHRRAQSVMLASPAQAAISHTAALYLHGLIDEEPLHVHLLRPVGTDQTLRGTSVHRTRNWPTQEIVEVGGIRTTSVGRSIVDVSRQYPPNILEAIVERAIMRRIAKPAELLRVFSSFVDDPSRRARLLLRILAWRTPNVSLLHLCNDIELIKAFNQAGLPRPSVEHTAKILTRSLKVDLAYPQRRIAIRFETQRSVHSQRFLATHQDQHMLLEDAGWCCVHADLEADLQAFAQHIGELLRSRPPIATPGPAS